MKLAKQHIKPTTIETLRKEKEKDFIRKERYQGSFYRSFTIPKGVKEDEIEAKFKEGVLTVNLPKMETSKPKTVKVE